MLSSGALEETDSKLCDPELLKGLHVAAHAGLLKGDGLVLNVLRQDKTQRKAGSQDVNLVLGGS